MYLVVKYKISGAADVAQMPNDNTALGITGVNFVGCNVPISMVFANGTATNNSHKASILPANSSNSGGTYVDKIESILLPRLDGTTTNYLSVPLDSIGINSDVCGVEFIGLNRTENDTIAAFSSHRTVRANVDFSVSKNRLIIEVLAAANAISGSIMNVRITYKN